MTDWPALAARFEAATDDDIYECVRELVSAVFAEAGFNGTDGVRPNSERHHALYTFIGNAEAPAAYPGADLLLGVVVACVPEGWDGELKWWKARDGNDYSMATLDRGTPERDDGLMLHSKIAALGAAVCRAWESVGKGEVG